MPDYSKRFPLLASTFLVIGLIVVSIARGSDPPPVAMSPGGPNGALALTGDACPRFRWEGAAGTQLYELIVYRIGEDKHDAELVLRKSLPGSVTSWIPEHGSCLQMGRRYAWSVRSWGEGPPTDWSEPNFFEVIDLTRNVEDLSTLGAKPRSAEPRTKRASASEGSPSPLNQKEALEKAELAFRARDFAAALRLLKPLAEQGNPRAQNGLGMIYGNGLGVERNLNQAVVWHRRAAEQGYARGQYFLGLMYADGLGVPKDPDEAVMWLRKAAEQDDAGAAFSLGVMYAKGEGVEKDSRQAAEWYLKATSQGYPLFFHFEPGWTVGHYAEQPNGDWIMEFIPEGDDIDDWTELLTIQKFDIWWGGATAHESLDLLKAERERICPRATEWKVLSTDTSSVLYEWQTHSCRGWPDQHEVAKIIFGKDMRIRLAYSAKAYRIPSSQRADWVERLSEATISDPP